MNAPFGRVLTAMVTPFTRDGLLDADRAAALAERLVDQGNDGLVISGTTGESPTTTDAEKDALLRAVVEAVGDRAHVVAGVGTYDTAHTVESARAAEKAGAAGLLVVTPYYSKPPQAGLIAHFTAAADATDLPVMVYDIPARAGVALEHETLLRLAEHPRIVAVKEASANLDQIQTIIRNRPSGFSVLAGDDSWTLTVLAHGGDGVISVASNEIPAEMAALCAAGRTGAWDEARRLHERYLPLMRANFITVNPVPVKAGVAAMGLIEDVVRQPLLTLADPQRGQFMDILRDAGVLPAVAAAAR